MASEPIRDHRRGKEEKQETQHGKPNEALCTASGNRAASPTAARCVYRVCKSFDSKFVGNDLISCVNF
jgi:hypothetical protein